MCPDTINITINLTPGGGGSQGAVGGSVFASGATADPGPPPEDGRGGGLTLAQIGDTPPGPEEVMADMISSESAPPPDDRHAADAASVNSAMLPPGPLEVDTAQAMTGGGPPGPDTEGPVSSASFTGVGGPPGPESSDAPPQSDVDEEPAATAKKSRTGSDASTSTKKK